MTLVDRVRHLLPLLSGVLLLTGLMAAASARADLVENLYREVLPAPGQALDVDPELAREALRRVLIRVSGRRALPSAEAISRALQAPQTYVQQFAYRPTGRIRIDEQGAEQPETELQIEFTPPLVDKLLRQAGLLPLGQVRPSVLVWVIVEERGQRRLLGVEDEEDLAPLMKQAAARGLPLYRPLLDLDDQSAVSAAELWGFFEGPIRRASARYASDAVAVARIYRERDGSWHGSWLLLRDEQRQRQELGGASPDEILHAGADWVADTLFADFLASPVTGESGTLLEVRGLTTFDQFADLTDYLRRLPQISTVRLQTLSEEELRLELDSEVPLPVLRNLLGLNPRLQAEVSPAGSADAAEVLRYRWSGQ